eukprot:3711635-Alexandrium_andersonii.AAC.1
MDAPCRPRSGVPFTGRRHGSIALSGASARGRQRPDELRVRGGPPLSAEPAALDLWRRMVTKEGPVGPRPAGL